MPTVRGLVEAEIERASTTGEVRDGADPVTALVLYGLIGTWPARRMRDG